MNDTDIMNINNLRESIRTRIGLEPGLKPKRRASHWSITPACRGGLVTSKPERYGTDFCCTVAVNKDQPMPPAPNLGTIHGAADLIVPAAALTGPPAYEEKISNGTNLNSERGMDLCVIDQYCNREVWSRDAASSTNREKSHAKTQQKKREAELRLGPADQVRDVPGSP